ncbi:ubiquinol-cytochrome C chaperone family protein [Chthonobacter albigriseus]|uniref:ubiquinol-cytochrome C chaperone family protein n=1 Tax=Chthonobacter albigriseus TaxID=1683161 RepID=UPI0015EF9EF0|nr:ubiquinol-cytochrome C chaperone family protein [Chthonobacter albigriseus]
MVFGLFRRRDEGVDAVYASVVGHARNPIFYMDYGVPDTVEGRFELIVAVCGLVVGRLTAAGGKHRDAARVLSETFFADMDNSLREMGISDVGVPKRMKKIAQAFFGRVGAYETAIAGADANALAAALDRNVYDGGDPASAARLAVHLGAVARRLAEATPDSIVAGDFRFPDPPSPSDTTP